MKQRLVRLTALWLGALLLTASCETDSYEKGTGQYSLMQADLALVSVDSQKQGVSFVTDDGEGYALTEPVTASWMETADTAYRAIIYYNKVETGRAEAVALGSVPTLTVREHWRLEEQPEDPVGLESAWVARNGRYINVGLLLRSGRTDDVEGTHAIGLAQDTVLVNADGTRTAYYRFLHSQGDTPEYYTNRRYVSILIPEDRPDSVRLSIRTYSGVAERGFAL